MRRPRRPRGLAAAGMAEQRQASAVASAPRRFSKMHGAGNDFVVLDLRDGAPPPGRAQCRAMADRHTGVGCDQLLTIEPPRSAGAVASYRIWNADGSPSQQCGNGARCIAAWLARDGLRRQEPPTALEEVASARRADAWVIDSPAGAHTVTQLGPDVFSILMGVPVFDPARIPLQGLREENGRYLVDFDGVELAFGAVSMGNPHAVIEVDDVDTAPVAAIGAWLQSSAWFTQSVNVGFVQVQSRDRVRLRVYERGAGETLACGSGACAAAAVLMRGGLVDRAVSVSLPGGELQIAWPSDDGPISMAGPAAFVFEGTLTMENSEQ